jgi:C-terminal processing protease CtpA/Prc
VEWIEGRLVVTQVSTGPVPTPGPAVGDAILSLDGHPASEVLAAEEAQTSGATPQWIRFWAISMLFAGPLGSKLVLEIEPFAAPAVPRTLTVTRDVPMAQPVKRRHETLAELEPGIFYLDLDRLTTAEFIAALPRLEQARGLVFDLRGYPGELDAAEFFPHLTRSPLQSAQWHVPHIVRPDRTVMDFVRDESWKIAPKAPFLAAKRAFVTDGRAISYAESCLGIVEYYHLGAIIGGATAGTNGNMCRMELPGGYSISWTGMRVLKQDGSRHHGVGILPTIPVRPTRAGIAAGRDELLERAIQAVKEN